MRALEEEGYNSQQGHIAVGVRGWTDGAQLSDTSFTNAATMLATVGVHTSLSQAKTQEELGPLYQRIEIFTKKYMEVVDSRAVPAYDPRPRAPECC